VLLDPAKLVEVEAELTIAAARTDYRSIVRAVAHRFVDSRKRDDDRHLPGLGLGALWTALNHPQSGQKLRQTVSSMLRREGKAHISWHCGKHGLAIAAAGRFIDLGPLAAEVPRRTMVMFAEDRDDGERGH
jgi:hypothetical protein